LTKERASTGRKPPFKIKPLLEFPPYPSLNTQFCINPIRPGLLKVL
jgi:hypothetical protein